MLSTNLVKSFTKTIIILVLMAIMISCNQYSEKTKIALEYAGQNADELERVLKFYDANSVDSLKYKAAVFLIENMPYHSYSKPLLEFNDAFDSIGNYPKKQWTQLHRDKFSDILGSLDKEKKMYFQKSTFLKIINSVPENKFYTKPALNFDIRTLSSDYIIKNIELAFKAWYRIPKDKRASFDNFCNYILPYRATNEPIENKTREKLLNEYSWVYNYLDKGVSIRFIVDSITSSFRYCNYVQISKFYPIPLSISQVEKSRSGLCDDAVNYFVNVFRSLGIISAKDMISHWGNHHTSGHSWIYIKYGEDEYSTDISGDIDFKKTYKEESIPKINRVTFKLQENSNHLPLALDVTNTYVSTKNIIIKNKFNISKNDGFALCVFDKNKGWEVVCYADRYTEEGYEVDHIGTNSIYLPVSVIGREFIPVNHPFYFKNQELHYLKPSKTESDSVTLTRKYGLSSPRNTRKIGWVTSLNGGIFQGANDPNFKKATTLYEISGLNSIQLQKIKLNQKNKFKYIRFYSNGATSYLATLAFYDKDHNELRGIVIKNENVMNSKRNGIGAFDNHPVSYSGGDDFALGWEFKEAKSVAYIEFQPRNDFNQVVKGHNYELFYWDNSWRSLGKKSATDTLIKYKTPKNSLLTLKNLTKGVEEHVFIIDENKKQYWVGFDNY